MQLVYDVKIKTKEGTELTIKRLDDKLEAFNVVQEFLRTPGNEGIAEAFIVPVMMNDDFSDPKELKA